MAVATEHLVDGLPAKFIVQDTWDEEDDQELLDFIKQSNVPLETLDEEQLLAVVPDPSVMVFADTAIIQAISKVPVVDTYPECFQPLYHRNIRVTKLPVDLPMPYFVKPCGNNKAYGARMVRDAGDAELALDAAQGEEVYVCDPVKFVSEHRLFLGLDKVWGVGEYSEFVLEESTTKSVPVPEEFIAEVVKLLPWLTSALPMRVSGALWRQTLPSPSATRILTPTCATAWRPGPTSLRNLS
eukprot:NODE_6109_length_879_cov_54.403439_g5878_i0.p1 GENE.NODE_6109_length_879_cov_54.403439_g5878_i0~~NODE_6109_length_879_cov_54.403439_g5878_i0.p1  ORF type:complete len:263 (+),score=56.15 NODE_6109_length_879_cov_54.403439_g5878_i0:69-791(+)